MDLDEPTRQTIEKNLLKLQQSNVKLAFAVSGAGTGLADMLWKVPGASSFFLSGHVPYHRGSFDKIVTYSPGHYCSEEAAVALATACFREAEEVLFRQGELLADTTILGLGLTGAVATNRVRKGKDRLHVAVRIGRAIKVATVELHGGSREEQGIVADFLALNTLFRVNGMPELACPTYALPFQLIELQASIPAVITTPVYIHEDGSQAPFHEALDPRKHAILSGSFNPLHFGHEEIARTAQLCSGKRIVYEIGVHNADKASISGTEVDGRIMQFRGRWPVIVASGLPRFIDKARVYGCDFVLGADTARRLLSAKFLQPGETLDGLLNEFRQRGVRFYMADRLDAQGRLEVAESVVPVECRDLFIPLPGRWDVSSTELRSLMTGREV